MRVDIRLLGGFDVTVDGRPIPPHAWRRSAASALVKLLALQPERRLRREQVVDALWPDLLLDGATPRLHSAAHYARAAVGYPESVLVAGGNLELCAGAEVTVDVVAFDDAADKALAEMDQAAAGAAADLYTGMLLPDDLYESWTEEPRERLQRRYLELLHLSGRYDEAVAVDPLDEGANLALVRHLLRQGRPQAALRALDRMTELFRRELGVEPGPAADALRAQAEAMPAEGRPRPALPAPRTRLIGRDADVASVSGLTRRSRIVTITGPGGAGKSTLALAVARETASHPAPDGALPDGDTSDGAAEVVLAELAPAQSEPELVRTVAEAAGVQGEGAVRAATLAATLGPRPVLLVLDNCEHLLDECAALVDAILDSGAAARILATSREPLRVDGEVMHPLGSLGQDATELFAERAAAAAGPGIVSADDPQVVDLCERLDGLPLAIELAAGQLRHLSLRELVNRLDERLTLLVGGRPRAGQRHSALVTTIEWSHRLLSDPARSLFDRLGVFPAGFDLGEVVAVAEESRSGTVTNLLGDLVAKSLVVHDPTAQRYRMLETIRLYAAERLDESGLRPQVTEQLRRHVTDRARRLPRVKTWLSTTTAARSRDDLENVRLAFEASLDRGDLGAAVDIALGVSTLWRNAVSYAEGRAWVDSLLARDLDPRDRLWALILAADVSLGSGDPFSMREASQEAVGLTTHVDDAGAAAICALYGAFGSFAVPERALGLLQETQDRARAADEPALDRLARVYRAVVLLLLGRTDGLAEEFETLTGADAGSDYDSYICFWAASLHALVNRDGARQRKLIDTQVTNLMTTGLRENWLTMYWEALAQIGTGDDYLPQLQAARRRAAAEGRSAEADCVLALAYAAACRDDWEEAAELLGATRRHLLRDTASYIHHALLRDQLVRPRLDPARFSAATARGEALSLQEIVRQHGL